eukprot:3221874-Pyramimonas_sp.AAC.1
MRTTDDHRNDRSDQSGHCDDHLPLTAMVMMTLTTTAMPPVMAIMMKAMTILVTIHGDDDG